MAESNFAHLGSPTPRALQIHEHVPDVAEIRLLREGIFQFHHLRGPSLIYIHNGAKYQQTKCFELQVAQPQPRSFCG